MQDNQDAETSVGKVQRENKRIKKSRWRRDFPHTARPALGGPHSLLYHEYRVSFPGVKRSGRGVNHPPPSSAEVKERVDLYH